jgi:mannitol/fructose-specific phosphotransferase system IIA component (Ntr-type)
MNFNLADLLTEEQILLEMGAQNRWDAIEELTGQLVVAGKVGAGQRDGVITALRKREQSMSTGIGFGVGLPHASTELVSELVCALGRSRTGIEFDALDGQPVHLVILLLVPKGQYQQHLHTVAHVARLLHNADFRDALAQAPDAAAILKIVRQHALP